MLDTLICLANTPAEPGESLVRKASVEWDSRAFPESSWPDREAATLIHAELGRCLGFISGSSTS